LGIFLLQGMGIELIQLFKFLLELSLVPPSHLQDLILLLFLNFFLLFRYRQLHSFHTQHFVPFKLVFSIVIRLRGVKSDSPLEGDWLLVIEFYVILGGNVIQFLFSLVPLFIVLLHDRIKVNGQSFSLFFTLQTSGFCLVL
jgi:hypothetical protein